MSGGGNAIMDGLFKQIVIEKAIRDKLTLQQKEQQKQEAT